MDKSLIGSNIKKVRKSKGITQIELADKAALSRTYLSDIECGRKMPGINAIISISNALGVDTSQIAGESSIIGKNNAISEFDEKLSRLSDNEYRLTINILEALLDYFNSDK